MFTQFVNYIQKNIGTSAVTLVTVPASNQLAVNQLSCANVTSLSVTCSVTVTRAGVTIFILRSATVPAGGSLICVGESQKIVLMAGDVLQVQSSTATSIDCVVSGVLNDFNRAVTVPAPPASPVATFSITPSTTSTFEGGTVTYNITTTNVPNGTVLYWQNFGTTSATDFTDDRNDGEFVITGGAGSFTRTLRNTGQGGDPGSETSETIQIALQFRPGYLGGGVVAGATTVTLQPDVVTSGLVLNLNAANPVSYPGSGTTWTDLSGFGNNGTLVNGVGYSSANNGSLVFDGTDDYVNLPNLSSFISPSLPTTWSAWVNVSSSSLNRIIIGSAWTTGGVHMRFTGTSHAPQDRIRFLYFQDGSNGTGFDSAATFTSGWTNFVATYNGLGLTHTNFGFYVNGVAAAVTNPTFGTPTTIPVGQPFTVGRGGIENAAYYNSNIAQVLLYNRVLTADEVAQNFSSARGRYSL